MPRRPTRPAPRPTVGRPRRTPEQEADVRKRVLEIAAHLFAEEGLQALTMRRIAREARVSPMGLYDYFRTKNEIVRGMWERFFAKCFARVERASNAAVFEGARRQLEAACSAYVDYWIKHPDEYRAVFMIEDRVERQEQYFVDTSPIMARYLIFAALLMAHHGQADGDLVESPLRNRARTLVCSLNGICHMLITVKEYPWPPAPRLLEELLRMVD